MVGPIIPAEQYRKQYHSFARWLLKDGHHAFSSGYFSVGIADPIWSVTDLSTSGNGQPLWGRLDRHAKTVVVLVAGKIVCTVLAGVCCN